MQDDALASPLALHSRPPSRTRADWLIPAALIALGAIPTLAGIGRLAGLARGVATMEGHARFAADPLPAVLHIVGATTFCVIGALQFSPGLRRNRPRWHRRAGWVLASSGIVAALSGMWMAIVYPAAAVDGPLLRGMRLFVGAAMVAFIFLGVLALRRRDFHAHGRWLTRSYALGIAAGTQALVLIPQALLLDRSETEHGYALSMGAGWIVNVVVAELALRRRRQRAPLETTSLMRAVVHDRYGGPEVLRIEHVPRPKPAAGQVLVFVQAASVNARDYRLLRANPFLVRLYNGLFRPRRSMLGADVAGIVVEIGAGITRLAIGDEIFGEALFADRQGTFAEYVCIREQAIAEKPQSISFIEAAAVPLAGITALQAVRDRAKVRPGQSVLVQGAGGGVGMFLVQIAKAYGAHVTAVCGPGSVELVRSLGADRVLDYTRDDLLFIDQRYDAIFGVNGFRPLGYYRERLMPTGTYVMVGGTNRQLFEALLFGKARFAAGERKIEVLTIDESLRAKDLEEIRGLLVDGRLRVVVDRAFSLEAAAEAFRYAEGGHVRGKVVLTVGEVEACSLALAC
ncbi:MAG: DUF2306 domain-containing protein [Polyangiaceae bacterium]|nr:DUF2306 domain-containing protein [Polyangiaceae bacterium]